MTQVIIAETLIRRTFADIKKLKEHIKNKIKFWEHFEITDHFTDERINGSIASLKGVLSIIDEIDNKGGDIDTTLRLFDAHKNNINDLNN